ncbi:MAG: cytochrome C, partial [Proteobacteria bacterium]|nr:cytochrome C [Pseudomonadota bacterium]
TSNSRRGFYGFGEETAMEADAEGIYQEDYQDDVHYGKTWTEANGETREIKNCNACHSESYYRPAFSNVDLDNKHHILKGNSDMDVRNDLDYHPAPKSCAYCHQEAKNPSIPSGHSSMLAAHKELWKANGDMSGYSSTSLDRITQTHFDVIACETCHITNKKSRGRNLQIMYRYRRSEDGKLRIIPYNPRQRYYWKDNNTGYVLNKTERNSVFSLETDDQGNKYGSLINPTTNVVLGTVGARMSHGSWRFSDPETYDGIVALKAAYDAVLANKDISNPDAVMVWTESNYYVMSHNTRLAVDSLQCEACHERKQDGSFSALISPNSVLGEKNFKQLTELPDRRLVDEGIVILDKPSMKLHNDGTVTQNIDDILYESKVNPSMSILNAAKANVIAGNMRRYSFDKGISAAELGSYSNKMRNHLVTSELYVFKPDSGDNALRNMAILMELNSVNEPVFATAQLQTILGDNNTIDNATKSGNGGLVSSVFNLQASYANGQALKQLPAGGQMLIKLPFNYDNAGRDNINLLSSTDGKQWSTISNSDIVFIQPQTNAEAGYILFWSDKFAYYTVANKAVVAPVVYSESSGGDGGGGSVLYLPILLLFGLGFRYLKRNWNVNL